MKKKLFNFSKIPWSLLTPEQIAKRNSALEVKRKIRNKEFSFTSACKKVGISPNLAKKHLGKFLYKQKKRYKVRTFDSIQADAEIYTKGERIRIVLGNSKDRSLIGEYFNAVQVSLEKNNATLLKKFKKKYVIDAFGKKHYFETDLKKIKEINEAIEHPELHRIIYPDPD